MSEYYIRECVKIAKIELDKYYTSEELAKYVVGKTKEIIGEENITEYLEPSAGGGVFLDYLDKPYLAYDIEPEDDRIVKHDYLTLDLEYKKGRCIIGNPPYGDKNNLYLSFYNKSIQLGDYISFILPINQFKNITRLYKFNLIYSEDLGIKLYSNVGVHCCFNIYVRPIDGNLNKRSNYKLKDIEIKQNAKRIKNKSYILPVGYEYDYAICSFGLGCVGKVPEFVGQYTGEYYIKIKNEKLKIKIIELLKNTNYKQLLLEVGKDCRSLPMWRLYKYIKEQIPEIE